jgi:hypothetical protein
LQGKRETKTMISSAPTVTPPSKRSGTLVRLLDAAGKARLGFRSHPVETLALDFEGIAGNRHRGWTRGADARVPYLPRGTTIRNTRHLSIVSVEDCAQIARQLDIPTLDPAWIGANIVVAGIMNFSFLPRGTRLFFAGGAIVAIEDQNAPCSIAGEAVQLANPGLEHIKPAFPKVAKGLRGVVATVEHPGVLAAGGDVTARLPEQWIYA